MWAFSYAFTLHMGGGGGGDVDLSNRWGNSPIVRSQSELNTVTSSILDFVRWLSVPLAILSRWHCKSTHSYFRQTDDETTRTGQTGLNLLVTHNNLSLSLFLSHLNRKIQEWGISFDVCTANVAVTTTYAMKNGWHRRWTAQLKEMGTELENSACINLTVTFQT